MTDKTSLAQASEFDVADGLGRVGIGFGKCSTSGERKGWCVQWHRAGRCVAHGSSRDARVAAPKGEGKGGGTFFDEPIATHRAGRREGRGHRRGPWALAATTIGLRFVRGPCARSARGVSEFHESSFLRNSM